ncbi:hypothetical protein H4V97_000691 [Flavobacterium sp. CG_23.5]|nr:hypothetical protein [Flavobacterium sp. CG_23.5]
MITSKTILKGFTAALLNTEFIGSIILLFYKI